jgi:DnaJ like chaperone protein
MSIWSRIGDFLSSVTTQALSSAVESLRTVFAGDPLTRRQVAFSIAIIALSAKMAKADGVVTDSEVVAFRELFEIPPDDARHVARLYNLAKQDVAGFEAYAGQIKKLFSEDDDILEDVMDGLFHIAKADGVVHELEIEFIERVAEIFSIGVQDFERIRLRHLAPTSGDPYLLLGASSDWTDDKLKRHYRKLLKEYHPDKMVSRGVPPEFLKIANDRMATINEAWGHIKAERGF